MARFDTRDWAKARRERTRHLIELGGLVQKAGLVDERRNGTRRLYRARPEGLVDLKAFLDGFWDDRLEALKRDAEQAEKERNGKHR